MPSVQELADGVRSGDRGMLSRAITLVESTAPDDTERAEELLQILTPDTGNALRLGITGPPGVGKSTFIETVGQRVTAAGHKLAVLTVDPTSPRTGGSILGDKTRMQELSRNPMAYVRPSPGGAALGGVTRRTREAIALCEAAGFDLVFVETIGVGQSEVAVADMVDCFVVMLLAGAGDELQGIKRGIMERADIVVVHKADGDNVDRVTAACADFRAALLLLHGSHSGWHPPVLACSAQTGKGLDEFWETVDAHRTHVGPDGLAARRQEQRLQWFDEMVRERLYAAYFARPGLADTLANLRESVRAGDIQPAAAARKLLATA